MSKQCSTARRPWRDNSASRGRSGERKYSSTHNRNVPARWRSRKWFSLVRFRFRCLPDTCRRLRHRSSQSLRWAYYFSAQWPETPLKPCSCLWTTWWWVGGNRLPRNLSISDCRASHSCPVVQRSTEGELNEILNLLVSQQVDYTWGKYL